ncbi:MAG: hypothetical protein CL683_04530 [Brevundimonas sp.]|jgi:hypothetical protein|uniref:ERF family protein n=1 Tax=Brevundimonas sp. TaxID=1871086 RepID=UPI000C54B9D5|nr:ERF family protein [Brevundimonas sp.]MAL88147.1 hypothetical protein [Brevundimonas sp.]|tara:strand:- start:192 stop:782 length:591 start_codon:yes stop_codon:yes gene_type:complete
MSEEIIKLTKKLQRVQCTLKAPKGQRNKFGNYNYRSAEDILEAIKPLLEEYNLTLVCNDRIEMRGNFMFNVTTAILLDCDSDQQISTENWAMHSESKKGMDSAQISGATASYSLKRALGNLFAIDNEQDADATNKHGVIPKNSTAPIPVSYRINLINTTASMDELAKIWKNLPKDVAAMPEVIAAKDKQKQKLGEK